jgi:hypothetical protein
LGVFDFVWEGCVVVVPRFARDADLDDPQQHLGWLFADWPKVGKSQPYPSAPKPLLPHHSEWAYRLGFRFHPELAELVKTVDGDGQIVFASVDEAAELDAARMSPEVEVRDLLAQVNPELASTVDGLSDGERADMLAEFEARLRESLDTLAQVRDMLGGDS